LNTSGGHKLYWPLLVLVGFQKSKKLHAIESGLFLSSGITRWMPLELIRVTFINLLKGNWFLGRFIFHKILSLDRCPVSGTLVGVSRWLPIDGFGALGSALQARKQMCSYLPLVHVLLKVFYFTSWC
jgi:hypothetical protein